MRINASKMVHSAREVLKRTLDYFELFIELYFDVFATVNSNLRRCALILLVRPFGRVSACPFARLFACQFKINNLLICTNQLIPLIRMCEKKSVNFIQLKAI